jgi:hypothetical protein
MGKADVMGSPAGVQCRGAGAGCQARQTPPSKLSLLPPAPHHFSITQARARSAPASRVPSAPSQLARATEPPPLLVKLTDWGSGPELTKW